MVARREDEERGRDTVIARESLGAHLRSGT